MGRNALEDQKSEKCRKDPLNFSRKNKCFEKRHRKLTIQTSW